MLEQIQIILQKGGVMMLPLGLCSFLILMICIEKLFLLRKRRLIDPKDLQQWKKWFRGKKGQVGKKSRPKNNSTILNQILFPLAKYFPLPEQRLAERVGDLSRKQKYQLERGLILLETIAGIAPMLGLLGTALGMVDVFAQLSAAEEVRMGMLSAGISQALFTTVAGLFIGIPSLIAYNLFSRKIEGILLQVEDQINDLMDEFREQIMTTNSNETL